MQKWPLLFGKFLFQFRSFTPLPLIALTFIFFKPLSAAPLWTVLGLIVACCGEGMRMHCVGYAGSGTSGRESFLKAESLNTTGLYSLARNPLYWGNGFIFAGLLILFTHPMALILFVAFLFLQYHFIVLAEEDFLCRQHGQVYAEYCGRVNRWLPRFKGYISPRQRFDAGKVFFKENDSCFNLLLAALLILAWKEKAFSGGLRRPWIYAAAALALFVFYAWVKVLKKKKKTRRSA